MDTVEIKSDVLKDAILSQTQTLDALKSAFGQEVDEMQDACDRAGISKQAMAIGIIFDTKGEITQTELAEKLNIGERTLRKRSWRRVRSFLQDYRQFPCW